jgi:hypothetical protein
MRGICTTKCPSQKGGEQDNPLSDEELESIRLLLLLDEYSRRTLVVYESGKPRVIPDGGTLYL